MSRVRVLGLGNVLMGDDGLGPYAVRVLDAAYEFPEEVSVIDLGTPGLDLMPYIAGAEALIIIDTVRASGRLGQVILYDRDQVMEHLAQPRLSPHDPGVKEALATLEFTGGAPKEVLLIGVIPERVATGAGLSPAVRRSLPAVVEAVVRELARRGLLPTPRVPPAVPDIWWEKPSAPAAGS